MNNKSLGAILIVIGTCLGAGMLALPVSTAPAGFLLGVALLVLTWGYMYLTGLLVLETNLWFTEEVSYISMAEKTLGSVAKWFTWLCFLLLLYSLITAYIMGGSSIFQLGLHDYLHINMPTAFTTIIWTLLFASTIYFGTHSADLINRIFMLGHVIAFALLATAISPEMHFHFRGDNHPYFLIVAIPIVFTSFGYHIVIPSMTQYLQKNAKKLRRILFYGSFASLCTYLIWQTVIYGNIPTEGPDGLIAILKSGAPAAGLIEDLQLLTHSSIIGVGARFFALFSLASSFIGVALGLFDLLADGCKIKKNTLGKFYLTLLTFVPPLIFSVVYPQGFILALSYAGVFVALLHGLLPAAMVWSGRYHLKIAKGYRVWVGKIGLLFVMLLAFVVIYAQIASNLKF